MAEPSNYPASPLETDDARPGGSTPPRGSRLPDSDSHPAPSTYRTRIIDAITGIALRSDIDTHTEGLLTSYVRYVSPSQVRAGPGDFPVTVRQHPTHDDAAALAGRWSDVLCYHVGAAILDYYKLYLDDVPAGVHARLEKRVELLESIRHSGPAQHPRTGNDRRGWRLCTLLESEDFNQVEEAKFDRNHRVGDGLIALAPDDDLTVD